LPKPARTAAFISICLGGNDMLIAAIALANHLTLVTHNTAEFSRVPGLAIEDWENTLIAFPPPEAPCSHAAITSATS
jgi:hypothetical protein